MHIERQVGKQKPFPSEHIILTSEQIGTTEICRQEHPEAFRKHKMLKDHFLLFVLEGKHEVLIVDKKYVINKGEMFLLKKATYAEFVKTGNPDNHFIYESVSFSLKKEIIIDFIKLIEMEGYAQNSASDGEVLIHPYGARLQSFLESMKPYFDDNEEIKVGLFKLKILELLYDLAHANPLFLHQLMSLKL